MKRCFVLLLMICILLNGYAYAYDYYEEHFLPERIDTVCGCGCLNCGDFYYDLNEDGTARLTLYAGTEQNAVIPETLDGHPVTVIARYAFGYDLSFGSPVIFVYIPDTVTVIEEEAFVNSGLSQIRLSENLEYIGREAFYRCPIESVYLPESLHTMVGNPFCCGSEKLTIQVSPYNHVFTVADGVLYDRSSRSIVCYLGSCTQKVFKIPDGTRAIVSCAFAENDSIEQVILHEGLETIGYEAFYGCSNLKAMELPESIAFIDCGAFSWCAFDKSEITFPQNAEVCSPFIADHDV